MALDYDQIDRDNAAKLAARTPEQIREDEEREADRQAYWNAWPERVAARRVWLTEVAKFIGWPRIHVKRYTEKGLWVKGEAQWREYIATADPGRQVGYWDRGYSDLDLLDQQLMDWRFKRYGSQGRPKTDLPYMQCEWEAPDLYSEPTASIATES